VYLVERDHLEDLGVYVIIILKWIFWKCVGEALSGLLWLRRGTGGRF
jgi:hypothetical protein